jgi:phosphate-selective porin OprO/OprP
VKKYKKIKMKKIAGIILSLTLYLSAEQISAQNKTPFLSYSKGLGISTPDSAYSLNFRFRMQSRFLMNTESEESLTPASFEARVRRMRLSFNGHVYNKKLSYYIQLSFSRGDMDWDMNDASKINTSVNIVRDAVIYYQANKGLQLGFGQTKLPGNRQRVVSSNSQQFYDRSAANATLTNDRDFGFFINYKMNVGKTMKVNSKSALTSGEGRNNSISNGGLAYTSRLEFLPFGEFTDGGDYYEGDLAREKKPKLSIGLTYSLNDMSERVGGQTGKDLYGKRSVQNYEADLLLKYRGFAFQTEYMLRNTADPITKNLTASRAIFTGDGINTQISYCFPSMYEIALRHTLLTPSRQLGNQKMYQINDFGIGLNKYLVKHKVKLQGNIFYHEERDIHNALDIKKNFLAVFQIEFGI